MFHIPLEMNPHHPLPIPLGEPETENWGTCQTPFRKKSQKMQQKTWSGRKNPSNTTKQTKTLTDNPFVQMHCAKHFSWQRGAWWRHKNLEINVIQNATDNCSGRYQYRNYLPHKTVSCLTYLEAAVSGHALWINGFTLRKTWRHSPNVPCAHCSDKHCELTVVHRRRKNKSDHVVNLHLTWDIIFPQTHLQSSK